MVHEHEQPRGRRRTALPRRPPGRHAQDEARLKAGAVGLFGVLFMAVANAAPITAMSFNVPIAVGYGNGIAVSGGYLFATIVLTIFTIGFVAMARYVTTAGAFYGFISQGLGQIWGMASGLLAAVAYIIFEASLIGGFAYFAAQYVSLPLGSTINWIWIALIGDHRHRAPDLLLDHPGRRRPQRHAGLRGLSCSGARHLGAVQGRPGRLHPSATPCSPHSAFNSLQEGAFGTGVAAGVAAIGIFFAFWSWVGYETTAVYGEESKNPKRNVPLATMIAVVGLGLFYTFMSWMVVVGNGVAQSVEISAGASPIDLWLGLVNHEPRRRRWRTSTSCSWSSARSPAPWPSTTPPRATSTRWAARAPAPFVRNTLGAVNVKHGSPAIASFVQSGITIVLCVAFLLFTDVYVPDADGNPVATPDLVPYVNVYGLLALIGTAMVLIVQTITSFAVIWFFWVKKVHKGNVLDDAGRPARRRRGHALRAVPAVVEPQLRGRPGGRQPGLPVDAVLRDRPLGHRRRATRSTCVGQAPEIYDEIGRTTIEEAHERV